MNGYYYNGTIFEYICVIWSERAKAAFERLCPITAINQVKANKKIIIKSKAKVVNICFVFRTRETFTPKHIYKKHTIKKYAEVAITKVIWWRLKDSLEVTKLARVKQGWSLNIYGVIEDQIMIFWMMAKYLFMVWNLRSETCQMLVVLMGRHNSSLATT